MQQPCLWSWFLKNLILPTDCPPPPFSFQKLAMQLKITGWGYDGFSHNLSDYFCVQHISYNNLWSWVNWGSLCTCTCLLVKVAHVLNKCLLVYADKSFIITINKDRKLIHQISWGNFTLVYQISKLKFDFILESIAFILELINWLSDFIMDEERENLGGFMPIMFSHWVVLFRILVHTEWVRVVRFHPGCIICNYKWCGFPFVLCIY